jgi:hypothetical protein
MWPCNVALAERSELRREWGREKWKEKGRGKEFNFSDRVSAGLQRNQVTQYYVLKSENVWNTYTQCVSGSKCAWKERWVWITELKVRCVKTWLSHFNIVYTVRHMLVIIHETSFAQHWSVYYIWHNIRHSYTFRHFYCAIIREKHLLLMVLPFWIHSVKYLLIQPLPGQLNFLFWGGGVNIFFPPQQW